jgi:uncharacterized protein YjbI with pentapeptide repeats
MELILNIRHLDDPFNDATLKNIKLYEATFKKTVLRQNVASQNVTVTNRQITYYRDVFFKTLAFTTLCDATFCRIFSDATLKDINVVAKQ